MSCHSAGVESSKTAFAVSPLLVMSWYTPTTARSLSPWEPLTVTVAPMAAPASAAWLWDRAISWSSRGARPDM